jgi:hypothetical protein
MGRDRIVEPETERLYISDGDFIDVKKRLNHGDSDDYFARISPYQTPGQPIKMETRQIRTSKVLVYLLGWSLTHKGKPIPMSVDMPENARVDVLNSLDKASFAEIFKAIDKYETKIDAEDAARKNEKDGGKGSSAISPSLVPVAGDMNGSEVSAEKSTTSS